MKICYPLEIAYCIEEQYEPDTRTFLLACGGLWKNKKGKVPYYEWCRELLNKSLAFCKQEKLK